MGFIGRVLLKRLGHNHLYESESVFFLCFVFVFVFVRISVFVHKDVVVHLRQRLPVAADKWPKLM